MIICVRKFFVVSFFTYDEIVLFLEFFFPFIDLEKCAILWYLESSNFIERGIGVKDDLSMNDRTVGFVALGCNFNDSIELVSSLLYTYTCTRTPS